MACPWLAPSCALKINRYSIKKTINCYRLLPRILEWPTSGLLCAPCHPGPSPSSACRMQLSTCEQGNSKEIDLSGSCSAKKIDKNPPITRVNPPSCVSKLLKSRDALTQGTNGPNLRLHVEELPNQDRVPLLLQASSVFQTNSYGIISTEGPGCCRSVQESTSSYSLAKRHWKSTAPKHLDSSLEVEETLRGECQNWISQQGRARWLPCP